MNLKYLKLAVITLFVLPLLAIFAFNPARVSTVNASADEPADTYKTKCQACHTAKAEKFFDPAKTTEEHVTVILKGKKGEKPPFMPAFETKGITEEQAKALAEYMKQLKTPAS